MDKIYKEVKKVAIIDDLKKGNNTLTEKVKMLEEKNLELIKQNNKLKNINEELNSSLEYYKAKYNRESINKIIQRNIN